MSIYVYACGQFLNFDDEDLKLKRGNRRTTAADQMSFSVVKFRLPRRQQKRQGTRMSALSFGWR
jgi:hypothetical protein